MEILFLLVLTVIYVTIPIFDIKTNLIVRSSVTRKNSIRFKMALSEQSKFILGRGTSIQLHTVQYVNIVRELKSYFFIGILIKIHTQSNKN